MDKIVGKRVVWKRTQASSARQTTDQEQNRPEETVSVHSPLPVTADFPSRDGYGTL